MSLRHLLKMCAVHLKNVIFVWPNDVDILAHAAEVAFNVVIHLHCDCKYSTSCILFFVCVKIGVFTLWVKTIRTFKKVKFYLLFRVKNFSSIKVSIQLS